VWDLGGYEEVREIWDTFYSQVDVEGVIFIINIITHKNRSQFNNVKSLFNSVRHDPYIENAKWAILFNVRFSPGQ
jgi:hypothetical protein